MNLRTFCLPISDCGLKNYFSNPHFAIRNLYGKPMPKSKPAGKPVLPRFAAAGPVC